MLVDGVRKSLRERIALTKTKKHDISVLVDSISVGEFKTDQKTAEERLSEAVEKAIEESDGLLVLRFRDMDPAAEISDEEHLMSAKWSCPKDGFLFQR